MNAEIIAVGSELVSGQALDTNSQWLSRALDALGIAVHWHATVGDDLEENVAALRVALGRVDLIILTGGLGPTQDDLTREALARVAGVPLVEDPAALDAIRALFVRRNREMPERNRVQALFPEGSEPLPNRVGTAPGVALVRDGCYVVCLPGVPAEMRLMFDEQVAPRLRARGGAGRVRIHHKINLFGKGEADVEADALDLTARGRVPEVGITAHEATISFRVVGEGATEDEARRAIAPTLELIRARFGSLVVGEGADDVAEGLVAELVRTGSTIATAESCTGGLVAHLLTTIPGISAYFPGGIVSYANEAKCELLGVPSDLLAARGAVSPEVAEAMAVGVRRRLRSDLGLSVTGVAGPTGGTPEKPVGLVYLGLATADGVQTRRLDLGPEQPRDVIQRRTAKHALNWARLTLLGR